jgi:M6 family metalloprotease-like protein
MKLISKLVAGLVVPVLILAGCASGEDVEIASPTPEATSTQDAAVDQVVEDCDTPEVDQMGLAPNANWNEFLATCPTDKTTPEPALTAVSFSNDLEPCMLLEDNADRRRYQDNTTGFPRATDPYRLPDGDYNVMVIPVDWPDLKDDADPASFLTEATELYPEWLETYSRGKVNLSLELYPGWITLDSESKYFSQSESDQVNGQWSDLNRNKVTLFWTEALKAADPYVDFTDVEIVMFILPRFQNVIAEFNLWPPGTGTYQTDEGPISRGFTPGSFQFRSDQELWAFWAHETMHYFKMPDLYWVDQGSTEKPTFNRSTYPAAIYAYDIMTTANSMRSLSTWLLWLLGWAEDSELTCLTEESSQDSSFEIYSNDNPNPETKAVMIKLSDHQLLLVESRRKTRFDAEFARSRDGVMVSLVDTTIPHGQGAITLIAPSGRGLVQAQWPGGETDIPYLDAILYEGNFIDIAGYHIIVNQAKAESDIVSVSRISDWSPEAAPDYVCLTKENREFGPNNTQSIGCPLVLPNIPVSQ